MNPFFNGKYFCEFFHVTKIGNSFLFNLTGAGAGIFQENQVNTMTVDALAPYIARSSAVMELTMWDTFLFTRIWTICTMSVSRNNGKCMGLIEDISMP